MVKAIAEEALKEIISPTRAAEAEAGEAILRTEELVKIYSKRRVVNEVSIEVKPGEIVGLLGPNGAGKTTTFYMIVGLISPNAGKIFLGPNELTKLPMYKRARRGVGYLSQEASIFRKLTVEENILAILQVMDMKPKERRRRAADLLEVMGVDHLTKSKAFTLSGGERRRVEIARALASEPLYLLLDEPFAGIDPLAVEDIQNIVVQLQKAGLGILVTDHNVRETLEITHRAYIMFEGRILISGDAEKLINDPEARKIYLGEKFRM
jgi:lipopolysaccharide export system ATP-binding protein